MLKREGERVSLARPCCPPCHPPHPTTCPPCPACPSCPPRPGSLDYSTSKEDYLDNIFSAAPFGEPARVEWGGVRGR